jgi:penicillin amidase
VLAAIPLAFIVAGFAAWVYAGVLAGGHDETGSVRGLALEAPVSIRRDDRGIPHVRAQNEHDLFFADGYLQGSDRLFQLDLYRRLVAGRLAEILGNLAIASDYEARTYDVQGIAQAQLAQLPARERATLDAFAAGVNAAIARRPLPPEFRVLGYRPEPWTARDSLVASFSTVLALTDSWQDVKTRSEVIAALGPHGRDAFFSISDPAYDSPLAPRIPAPVATLPALTVPYPSAPPLYASLTDTHAGRGSNDFAAGATLTRTHRALLANDPHLELRVPGVWWLVDLEAPGYHAAGATLPGVPGVVLGHDAHIAWGATNGTVATVRIYRERFTGERTYLARGKTLTADVRHETFHVRLGSAVTRDYLRTRHGFVFAVDGKTKYAAAWTADTDRRSSLEQFDALDRASSTSAALAALARYPGPPQNFVVADDRGAAAYSLAGDIPLDDAWGLIARDGASDPATPAPNVPFGVLPHVAASRAALVYTANDRTYGKGYPYRLSAAFSPPYRAARIARLLAHPPYDVASFSGVQADIDSLPERDLARATGTALARARVTDPDLVTMQAALAAFDGRFVSDSHAAVYANAVRRSATERLVRMHLAPALARRYLESDGGAAFVALMRALRERPRGWVPRDDYPAFLVASARDASAAMHARGQFDAAWSVVGARTAQPPLAGLGLSVWNGVRFPGFGDAYSPHVQAPANAQSFRAVWDVGNWDAGGIVIPLGESGQPGSPHYRDLAQTWLAGTLVPLPFDEAAVARATQSSLELQP